MKRIAGSTSSLLAGLIFGALAALGAYQVSQDSKNVTLALGLFGWDEW